MTPLIKHKNLIIASCLSLVFGIFLFAWYHDWIVITIPPKNPLACANRAAPAATYKKKIVLFYPKQDKEQQETKEILWSNNDENNAFVLVQAWASLLNEEEIMHKKITVQAAAIAVTQDELIISFDRAPFNKDDAAFKKLRLMQTLLNTVHGQLPTIQKIRFLMHHKPLNDIHLDFSQPWSLELRSTSQAPGYPSKNSLAWLAKPQLTIMVDPMGDAKNTGRTIDDTFERSITMQCAQELKKTIEEHIPSIRVILTRFPGEAVELRQNAAFANRMRTDIYINIACYKQTSGIPHCALYQFLHEPAMHDIQKNGDRLTLTPLSQAHQKYGAQSSALATMLYTSLQTSERAQRCILEPVYGFPYKPLMGVHAAALAIELGLPKKDDWKTVIDDIAQALLLCLLSNRQ